MVGNDGIVLRAPTSRQLCGLRQDAVAENVQPDLRRHLPPSCRKKLRSSSSSPSSERQHRTRSVHRVVAEQQEARSKPAPRPAIRHRQRRYASRRWRLQHRRTAGSAGASAAAHRRGHWRETLRRGLPQRLADAVQLVAIVGHHQQTFARLRALSARSGRRPLPPDRGSAARNRLSSPPCRAVTLAAAAPFRTITAHCPSPAPISCAR